MAYQGRKVFVAGTVLTASDMNSTVDQTVMVFTTEAARTTAIPTPTTGMATYISTLFQFQVYNGTTWTQISGGGGGGPDLLLMGA